MSQMNASHFKVSEVSEQMNCIVGGEPGSTGVGPIKGNKALEGIKEDSQEAVDEEIDNMVGNIQFQLYKLKERMNHEITYRELLKIARDTTSLAT